MRLLLRDITGTDVLAGALRGRAVLSKLLNSTITEPSLPEPVFLDFEDIEVATASFLRESTLAFREIVRSRRSNFYPVIANANETVREELAEVLDARGDVMMACSLSPDGTVSKATPLGQMDPKQLMTFELIQERGETDAGELMREFGASEGVTRTTAWNNRLSSLASLGLVVEVSQGRTKRYRPLFEGV
jgi:hypothetical protein